jgi:hypothetical protein
MRSYIGLVANISIDWVRNTASILVIMAILCYTNRLIGLIIAVRTSCRIWTLTKVISVLCKIKKPP